LLCVPLLLFPELGLSPEVSLFWGVAAFALAGGVAGRAGTFPWAAFAVTFVGGFIGYAVFFGLALLALNLVFMILHALIAGMSGWASATRHVSGVRMKVHLENEEKRRCKMCGVRVGIWAKKCWSCRASLARYS
jgi:hypothetical protein